MAQKEERKGDPVLPLLILFVFAIAGGIYGAYFASSTGGFLPGLFVGFLIGVAVLLTIEYAKNELRRN